MGLGEIRSDLDGLSKMKLDDAIPKEYCQYYNCGWKKKEEGGFQAGVALLTKIKPERVTYGVGQPELDHEGRVITAEFDKFFVVNTLVPSSGENKKNLVDRCELWDPIFKRYIRYLDR